MQPEICVKCRLHCHLYVAQVMLARRSRPNIHCGESNPCCANTSRSFRSTWIECNNTKLIYERYLWDYSTIIITIIQRALGCTTAAHLCLFPVLPDRLSHLADSNFIICMLFCEAHWQNLVRLCVTCWTFITILLYQLHFVGSVIYGYV